VCDLSATAAGQDLSKYNLQNNYGTKAVKQIVSMCQVHAMVPKVTADAVIARASASAQDGILTAPTKKKQKVIAGRAVADDVAGAEGGGVAAVGTSSHMADAVDADVPEDSSAINPLLTKFERYRADNVFVATMKECLETIGIIDTDKATVNSLLNRMLGLEVHRQNLLFAYFVEVLEMLIEQAKKDGRYSEGVVDVTGERIEVKGEPTVLTPQITHFKLAVDRGISFATAFESFRKKENAGSNFYVTKKKQFGRHHYLLATPKHSNNMLVFVTRPNTGESRIEMDRDDLNDKYTLIERAQLGQGEEHREDAEGSTAAGVAEAGADGMSVDLPAAFDDTEDNEDEEGTDPKDDTDPLADDDSEDDDIEVEDGATSADDDDDGAASGGGGKNKLDMLQTAWAHAYHETFDKCVHYGTCKAGAACTVGARLSVMNLLCGSIVAAWSPLSRALSEMQGLSERVSVSK
jgi:hypothetical protein